MYPQMPELPAVLGSEVAGELDGARVMGFVRSEGGGYAERVAVDRRWLLPLPESASFAEGAAFPMAFLTAWIPLTELVRIAFGARVLVTAAAGAVGTAAVQIVKALNGASRRRGRERGEARAPALARRGRGGHVRADRRARPGRRRLRPRRR